MFVYVNAEDYVAELAQESDCNESCLWVMHWTTEFHPHLRLV